MPKDGEADGSLPGPPGLTPEMTKPNSLADSGKAHGCRAGQGAELMLRPGDRHFPSQWRRDSFSNWRGLVPTKDYTGGQAEESFAPETKLSTCTYTVHTAVPKNSHIHDSQVSPELWLMSQAPL